MADISAGAVMKLRERTGLGLMECKKALTEAGGDPDKAYEEIRKAGIKTKETGIPRETNQGRMGLYIEPGKAGALVELQCETAPVAANAEFIQLVSDLARQLATGPGAATPEELLAQKSPGNPQQTLGEQTDWLRRRIREEFKLSRIARFEGQCGGYAHHGGKAIGVLIEVVGGTPEAAKDVCMHIVAHRPAAVTKEDLPADLVAKERDIQTQVARKEGKPENIIAKMIDGRMRNFYAEKVLTEQPFVKDDKKSVGKFLQENGMTVKRFVCWELGKE
jgi:elongation factor Ts